MNNKTFKKNKKQEFKHIITTNFGIGIFDYEWLINRLEIFKLTTLTSLSNQSCMNFSWYIFIHEKLPNSIFYLLEESLKRYPDVDAHIIRVPAYDKVHLSVEKIKNELNVDFLISSRIDDDDFVYIDAVRTIQEKALQRAKDYALIAFVTGADYLPIDDVAVPRNSESIALMLSMVATRNINNKFLSINEFAHHLVVKTLEQRGLDCEYIGIEDEQPLYLYVKHPLSDSFYAGARARMIQSPHKFTLTDEHLVRFGISGSEKEKLSTIANSVPNGMPYKYLEQLNNIRKKILSEDAVTSKDAKFLYSKLSQKATKSRPWSIEKRKIRIAILGSCVSRDLFEICPELQEKFEICFYNTRSSLISYVSSPCADANFKNLGNKFEEVRATYDVEKSHWEELKRSCPDMIMLDFIDERIGSINHNGTWITASGPIVKSFERKNLALDIIRPWSDRMNNLRPWALNTFMEKVLSITDNIVVHKAAWSEKMILDKSKLTEVDSKWEKLTELNNSILNSLFDLIDNNFPMVEKIGGLEIGMHAGGEHLWEFSPFHYDKSYYKSLAKQLIFRAF
ncbi:DUF6270 domain-containing protein [Escherichia coli]|uniref:DUF6270 domain-containing protein n=1 Tax=Escherichia coli TaxID=562 RepID=UPI002AB5172B|nr:DUF6270 domain-containing protein [Escherichia coli]